MKKFNGFFSPLIFLLIKWSGIAATDGRGKVGGSVFSKSRAGAYVRNKVTPVNRRTSFQQEIRATLAIFSQGFRALTQAQITAWNNAAANGFSTTNIFGDQVKKSGLGLYCGLNMNLATIGESPITTPPTQGSVDNMLSIAPTADVSATELFLVGTNQSGTNTVPANTTLVIVATAPVSAGISFVKSQFRIIGTIAAAADTTTTNMWSAYVAKFGAPVAGQKIFVGCTAVNLTTGQAGIPFAKPVIVAA